MSMTFSPQTWALPPTVYRPFGGDATRLRMLLSYYYLNQSRVGVGDSLNQGYQAPGPLFFLDSGAFSAATLGQNIRLSDYGRYAMCHREHLHLVANLDVIGNAKATWKHQQTLEAWGLDPLPVFHYGEPWRYLERYLEQYPYVALGGLAGRSRADFPFWLEACFKRATRTGAALHGFGVLNPKWLYLFPWYSVDGSTWSSGTRWGRLKLWDGEQLVHVNVKREAQPAELEPHRDLLAAYGFTPKSFCQPRCPAYIRQLRRRVLGASLSSYLALADAIRAQHGPQVIPDKPGRCRWQDEEPGLHLYFADAVIEGPWLAVLDQHLRRLPFTQYQAQEEYDALDPA